MKLQNAFLAVLACAFIPSSAACAGAQSPIDSNTLAISGDYTLTYIVDRKDTSQAEFKEWRIGTSAPAIAQRLYENSVGRPLLAGEAIPESFQRDGRAQAEKYSMNVHSMLLTVSAHGTHFLYRLTPISADATTSSEAGDWASEVMIYDGKQSFHTNLIDGNTNVYDGFDGRDLAFLPLFSGQFADVPVFKNLKPRNASLWEGEVFHPGDGVDDLRTVYPLTQIHYGTAEQIPRIDEMTRRSSDGTVSYDLKINKFVKFKGKWLLSDAVYNKNIYYHAKMQGPLYQIDYLLKDAKPSALADDAYKIETYLKPNASIRDNRSQARAKEEAFNFLYSGAGDFDQDERDAMLRQK